MGCKRPFEGMEFEELRFKHSRQLEYINKPTSFSGVLSCYGTRQEALIPGKDEGESCKFHRTAVHAKDTSAETSTLVGKDFIISNPLSLVTNSPHEEHISYGLFGALAYSPSSPGSLDFDFPRRPYAPSDDVYSLYLDCSPRRQVPVGPNHQASIPIWRGNINEKKVDRTMFESEASFSRALLPDLVDNYNEERLMGTFVTPMPDSNLPSEEDCEVGTGRTECDCLDAGSVRCVRQHVMEKRESLRKSLGDEKFVNLGFCEMGEVSCRWSEEEEHTFHEAVYSNPASLGRNFWKHLSALFPTRTKREIVSYYFNVFMLRKRASQNRSKLLEIDSDDDEWHENNGGGGREARDLEGDEDSAIESLVDQDDQQPHEDLSEEESEDDESSDGGDDYDGNVGHGTGDVALENGTVDHISKQFTPEFVDGCKFHPVDKISDSFQDDCVFQDDSCMSFECPTNMSDSCGPVDGEAALRGSETKSENSRCRHSESDASPGVVEDHLYLPETLDAKVWDTRYSTRPVKSFDLLPWNMIEDIFGEGKDDPKTRDGQD